MAANGCHSIKGASGTVYCAHLCTHLHAWEGPTLCKWHHYFGSAGGEYVIVTTGLLGRNVFIVRDPLSTGTVKSKRFNFALDDDDFEDTPEILLQG